MVEVPAVVLEGSINGSVWEEIPFRYAPFVEERAPRRTAPHQPRLDWQLWFAALGHYQHNPWLLHLMYRITTRIPSNDAALQLLDVDAYPFREKPPAFVRAWLYHYDFTRAPSRWARSIPGTELCGSDCTKYWKTNADQGVRPQGRLDAAANAGRRAPTVARRSRSASSYYSESPAALCWFHLRGYFRGRAAPLHFGGRAPAGAAGAVTGETRVSEAAGPEGRVIVLLSSLASRPRARCLRQQGRAGEAS